MKKIFLIAFIGCLVTQINAQTSPDAGKAKFMSAEEANKLNGVAQPTINGKPYSQYKAEQEALKQQQQKAANTTDVAGIQTISPGQKPAEQKPVTTPVNKYNYTPSKAPEHAIAEKKVETTTLPSTAGPVFPEMKGSFVKGNSNVVVGTEKPEDKTRNELNKVQSTEIKPDASPSLPAGVKPEAAPKKE